MFRQTKSKINIDKVLLHGATKGHEHSEKEQAKDQFEIKNSDRNGPEGQFMTASTTMCNAGSPP